MRAYVTFLWNDGFRNYTPEHVNILARALAYWDSAPLICVTDVPGNYCPEVQVFPMPKEAARLGSLAAPQGKDFPSSYRRLWCFSEAAQALGDRIMMLDLDAMIVGPLDALWAAEGDFVGWRPMSIWGREDRIGGGTWMLKTGTVTWLWEKFIADPVRLITETKALGWTGSDQAILSRFLHARYPQWPQMCGIYGSQDGVFHWDIPPSDARIIHFNGSEKAWNQQMLWTSAYHSHFGEKASGCA